MQGRIAIFFAPAFVMAVYFPARAQDSVSLPVKNEIGEALNVLIDSYTSVAAGWQLEKTCRHLPPEMDSVFRQNRRSIAAYLSEWVLPEVMARIEQSALEAGAAVAAPCGSRTNRLVTRNFQLAEGLAGLLPDKPAD